MGLNAAKAVHRFSLKGWLGARKSARPQATAPPASRGLDLLLLGCVLALLGLGVVMVYSSSAVYAASKYGDGMHFLKRHVTYATIGLCALYLGARIDYHIYQRFAYPLLGGTLLLLGALLVPGLGTRVDGATRWFRVAGLSFQPSELAKLTLVIYLACSLAKKRAEHMQLFTVGFLPHLCIAGLVTALVLKQPDLGSAAILLGVTLVMLFVGGTKLSYLLISALAATPIVYQQIVGTPWRLRRLIAFLDPWAYRQDAGYQMSESLISVGSGGVWGLGLGAGKQKLFFLPAAHTDFVFAIAGEELGFIGLALILLLFTTVLLRGSRAALGARDAFGAYLAFGITTTLGLQGALHMAVVLGMVPTKGITLPFFSYGGTALLMSLFCCGILLNIAARNPLPEKAGIPTRRTRITNRKRIPRVTVVTT